MATAVSYVSFLIKNIDTFVNLVYSLVRDYRSQLIIYDAKGALTIRDNREDGVNPSQPPLL